MNNYIYLFINKFILIPNKNFVLVINKNNSSNDEVFFISGLTYAMMSMKVILATILRKCIIKRNKIIPVKDIKVNLDILSKPVDPIMLRFEKRIKNKNCQNNDNY